MDCDGVRLPPKPAPQLSTAVFTSPQLDLTPEKKTSRPKKNISMVPAENKTEESKEIYAWYVNTDILFLRCCCSLLLYAVVLVGDHVWSMLVWILTKCGPARHASHFS